MVWWAGSQTIPRYFEVQAQVRSIWEDMNAPQAEAAQELRRSATQYRVFLSPGYMDAPARQYLAASAPVETWPGMEALCSTLSSRPTGSGW